MTIIEFLSMLVYAVNLVMCLRFLLSEKNRKEDSAVLAGIAFSSLSFIMMQTIRALEYTQIITIEPTAHGQLVDGFFMLNSVIFFCVALAIHHNKQRRVDD